MVGVDLCLRRQDSVAFVMPYVRHDKFHDYFNRLDARELQLYMRNLLRAICRVHSFGIIHRDVKPSNFLHDRKTSNYLLVDFGLAQSVQRNVATMPMTTEPMTMLASRDQVAGSTRFAHGAIKAASPSSSLSASVVVVQSAGTGAQRSISGGGGGAALVHPHHPAHHHHEQQQQQPSLRSSRNTPSNNIKSDVVMMKKRKAAEIEETENSSIALLSAAKRPRHHHQLNPHHHNNNNNNNQHQYLAQGSTTTTTTITNNTNTAATTSAAAAAPPGAAAIDNQNENPDGRANATPSSPFKSPLKQFNEISTPKIQLRSSSQQR